MATISNTPRPGYVWDSADNVWYPIGVGAHQHTNAADTPAVIPNALVDAKGDLLTATADNTPARLAVGSNNTVLTADSSTATGLKWATPSTGALTVVKAETTFTTVSNTGTTFDGVFSSAYNNYVIVFDQLQTSNDGQDINFQMRYAGPTTETDGVITGAFIGYNTGGTLSNWYMNNATATKIGITQSTAGRPSNIKMDVGGFDNGNAAGYRLAWNYAGSYSITGVGSMWRNNNATYRTYTGFILSVAAGTITGRATVYGLAKA